MNVWYAAYGSNILRERFMAYLNGGPVPNATDGRQQQGARNSQKPLDDRPHLIERTLLFAKSSQRWGGGGVAFLDPVERPAQPTKGRAWLVTLEQLEDVYRQENGQETVAAIDLDRLIADGSVSYFDGWYGHLMALGELDGLPVVTFTAHERPDPFRHAHSSYLDVIARGLIESWGLSRQAAEQYLATLPQAPVGSTR